MTEELIGKISFKNNKTRVKVTYEVECDSISGQVSYGNLVDIVDVIPIEKTSSNIDSKVDNMFDQEDVYVNSNLKVWQIHNKYLIIRFKK